MKHSTLLCSLELCQLGEQKMKTHARLNQASIATHVVQAKGEHARLNRTCLQTTSYLFNGCNANKWHCANIFKMTLQLSACKLAQTHTQSPMQKQPGSFRACKHQLLAQLHYSLRHQSQGASSPHCWLLKFVFGSQLQRILHHAHYEFIHLVLEITHTRKSLS